MVDRKLIPVVYGLYHVNPMTNEVVPYNDPAAHGLTKTDADQRLHDICIGESRGSAYGDHWITEIKAEE